MKKFQAQLRDTLTTDGKTLVSCRDGYQNYYGHELGSDEYFVADKVYKVYRSPELIASLDLIGVPITDEHVNTDKPFMAYGTVTGQEIMKVADAKVDKTIEVKNKVNICKDLQKVIDGGKNELSLGYTTQMVDRRMDSSSYDFEQVSIIPNHLAVVDAGRCGDACCFEDENKKGELVDNETAKDTLDATQSSKNLQTEDETMQIENYTDAKSALALIVSQMSTFDAAEVASLKDKLAAAGVKDESEAEMKARKEKEEKEKKDMEAEKEEKSKTDAKTVKDAASALTKGIADGVKAQADVMGRAVELGVLAADYSYIGKDTLQIMKDCVATQHEGELTDAELPTAFKMLKKATNPHATFGDSANMGTFAALANKGE